MSIEMKIPKSHWEKFKAEVLNKFFTSDNPVLTRHKGIHSEYEYARFSSEYKQDVDYVISIIPDGTKILKVGDLGA